MPLWHFKGSKNRYNCPMQRQFRRAAGTGLLNPFLTNESPVKPRPQTFSSVGCAPRAPRRRAGRLSLVLLAASTVALAAGEDNGSDYVIPHTDFRQVIVSEHKFVPHPAPKSSQAPSAKQEPPRPAIQDLVNAAPDIHKQAVMNHLDSVLLQEDADARSAAMASKLGIGVRSVHVGKYLVAGAATVFYIPVAVGIGFAW